MKFLKKLKIELPHNPAIPLLGLYPDKTKGQKIYICTLMFTAALRDASSFHWGQACEGNWPIGQLPGTFCLEALCITRKWVRGSKGSYYLHTLCLFCLPPHNFPDLYPLQTVVPTPHPVSRVTSCPVLFLGSSLCLPMSCWAHLLFHTSPIRSHLAEKRWNDFHFRGNKCGELEM